LRYPPLRLRGGARRRRSKPQRAHPIVIVGATGTLGRAFARLAKERGLAHLLLRRCEFDIADHRAVQRGIEEHKPWAVINAAGFVRVDEAETNHEACRRENEIGPGVLAEACGSAGVALVSFSSDLVFDGAKSTPYLENDPVAPLSVYGATKAAAEQVVLERAARSLVIRTSAFFGPWDHYNFVAQTIDTLRRGEPLHVARDVVVSPTYVPHLVHSTLDLLIDGATGLWHLANEGEATWAVFAEMVAERAGLDRSLIRRLTAAQMSWRARRPAYSALASTRGRVMPSLPRALDDYFARVVA
jgi:dTDP-4-dehydrorhamnose reductase